VGPGDQHNVYDRDQVTVELSRPDDGSFPRRVRAWAYVARPAKPSPPSRRYLDTILRGARHHRLPEEYIAKLAAVAAAPESVEPSGGVAESAEPSGGAPA
jgi:AIG2 family protein